MPVTSKEIRIARRIAKRTRVFAACARCKASKVKCNDYRPCNKCAENFNSCNEPIARGSETTNLIVKAARAFNDDTVMNSVHFDNVMSRPLVPNSQFSKITDEDRSRRGPVPTTMLGYKNSMLDSQFPMLNVLAQTAPQQFLPSGPTQHPCITAAKPLRLLQPAPHRANNFEPATATSSTLSMALPPPRPDARAASRRPRPSPGHVGRCVAAHAGRRAPPSVLKAAVWL